jgi:hypothetical protein
MAYTSGLTEQKDLLKIQAYAEEAIDAYRIVTGGTATDGVVLADDSSVFPLGISGDAGEVGKDAYASGDAVAVRYSGIAYCKMTGSGNRFALVIAGTNGVGKARTVETGWCVGIATKNWSDGEIIPVIIHQVYIEGAGS